jgi:FAD/FMN-containing dehydrogenase
MNEVRLHDAFVPEGCAGKVQPLPAVSAGAGAMWIDLYHAVTQEAGRYVQGGGCTTVGVAGLVQSGGFGSFSKGFIIADGEGAAYPGMAQPAMDLEAAHRDARAIERATAELRKVAPDAGSYVSESNFFNKRWQQDYWGEHYPRLRSVKKKYDPEGLFFVHNGVGSEDWSADGFIRLA